MRTDHEVEGSADQNVRIVRVRLLAERNAICIARHNLHVDFADFLALLVAEQQQNNN